jgi:hypothetical protein
MRSRHRRRALSFEARLKTCSSHANPRSLLLHPEGELPMNTWGESLQIDGFLIQDQIPTSSTQRPGQDGQRSLVRERDEPSKARAVDADKLNAKLW